MNEKLLVVNPDTFDVLEMGTDMLDAQVFGNISDDEHEVEFRANFDITFEVTWESDSEPTYVPYGSTSVLYDSGEGGIDHIELVDIDLTIDSWIDVTDDPDGVELTDDEVEQLFGMNVDEIKRQILDALDTYVRNNAEQYIYDNAEKPDIDWLDEEYLSEDISNADIDKDIDKDTYSDEEIAAAKKRIMPGYHYNGKYNKETIDKAKRRAELIKGADKACNEEIDSINVAADLDLAKDAKWNKKKYQ